MKIPFKVAFFSDEDSENPAVELNDHGPNVFGWHSKKSSTSDFPKEIVLKFDFPATVVKIQVLAHQFLIPQRIEFWLSNSKVASSPSRQNFEYMGFVSLSDNSISNFQSRELKSVSIKPELATHLKLKIGHGWANVQNTHNQVALIAVNVIGEKYEQDRDQINDNQLETTSLADDLGFCMYVEQNIADIFKTLEKIKNKAVKAERFEYARKLKLCMNALRPAGERLGRYTLAKRMAVKHEDFHTARLRKMQIELYTNAVLLSLNIDQLLEKDGIVPENDNTSENGFSKPLLPSPISLQDVSTLLIESCNKKTASSFESELVNKQGKGSLKNEDELFNNRSAKGSLRRTRNKSAPRYSSNTDYDDRTVSALKHSLTSNEFAVSFVDTDQARGRSKLNEREKRQNSVAILIFGMELVELFYSRNFVDREDALVKLRSILKDENFEHKLGYNKTARGATLLLHRTVREQVFSVFNQTAETIRCFFVDFIPGRVSISEIGRSIDRLLPELLSKSGDPSSRVHNLGMHTILSIAAVTDVKDNHLVAPLISRPVTNGSARISISRMQMIEQLILAQGICNDKQSGMTARTLSDFGISGLNHASEGVRKVAEKVILLVYNVNPRLVRKQLPPDDDITRRNLLYRHIFTEFDKIDVQELSKESTSDMKDRVSPVQFYKQRIYEVKNGHSFNELTFKNEIGCAFCEWKTDEAQELDKHYWKFCPFLTKCSQCHTIMKVSDLNDHLIVECDAKGQFTKCETCFDAVRTHDYPKHKLQEHCKQLFEGNEKCPLCHYVVMSIEEIGWKRHLLEHGCPAADFNRTKTK
ncbi:unnamed protein product [Diamesa serratosioi]